MVRTTTRRLTDYTRKPFDAILGVPSHIAILRALKDTAAGATGREISKEIGVAHQATVDGLTRLEAAGLVSRQIAGRAHVFRLNRDHHLVAEALLPLFRTEAEFAMKLRASLKSALKGVAITGAIFGSTARREDSSDSDLDVCVIVKSSKDKDRALRAIEERADDIARVFGRTVSPVALTQSELQRRFASGDDLVRNIVRESESFMGPGLRSIASA